LIASPRFDATSKEGESRSLARLENGTGCENHEQGSSRLRGDNRKRGRRTRVGHHGCRQRLKRAADIAKPSANIANTRIDNRRRTRPEDCATFKVNYKWQPA
jgi:hypothetical protein